MRLVAAADASAGPRPGERRKASRGRRSPGHRHAPNNTAMRGHDRVDPRVPQDPRQWHLFAARRQPDRGVIPGVVWHDDLVACERTELAAFYRRYIDRCNEHRFDELDEFVDQNVEVNGAVHGLQKYQAGLRSVVDMFPNSQWDLQHLLIDDCWLGAHLTDRGTGVAGGFVTIQEFAIYRVAGGRIVAVWGDLDEARLAAS
jgi:predicted ester cyclase